jgi:hypothetical protein
MPHEEETNFSERDRALVEEVAELWGVSFEEAADRLRREGMAARFKAGTKRAPARVFDFPPRKKADD